MFIPFAAAPATGFCRRWPGGESRAGSIIPFRCIFRRHTASWDTPKGRFQELNPLERPGWDELILSHREASFFHTAGWASVLQDTYGHTPHYFGVLEGERLSALLPLMEVNSLWTGRRGVSLPFTDECP